MSAVTSSQWREIGAACDLLAQIAYIHAAGGDMDAAHALEWLQHMSGVVATKRMQLAALHGAATPSGFLQ